MTSLYGFCYCLFLLYRIFLILYLGSVLFSQMFRKNKPLQIFKFLDEKSSLFQDIQIMRSFPTTLFIKQFVKRLFGARH